MPLWEAERGRPSIFERTWAISFVLWASSRPSSREWRSMELKMPSKAALAAGVTADAVRESTASWRRVRENEPSRMR